MKFTFKTIKPTGKYKAFFPTSHTIKLGKSVVGEINEEDFKIRLMVIKDNINEDKNPRCVWKMVTLVKKNSSLQEAKDFLNQNFKAINEKYRLYQQQ